MSSVLSDHKLVCYTAQALQTRLLCAHSGLVGSSGGGPVCERWCFRGLYASASLPLRGVLRAIHRPAPGFVYRTVQPLQVGPVCTSTAAGIYVCCSCLLEHARCRGVRKPSLLFLGVLGGGGMPFGIPCRSCTLAARILLIGAGGCAGAAASGNMYNNVLCANASPRHRCALCAVCSSRWTAPPNVPALQATPRSARILLTEAAGGATVSFRNTRAP